MSDVLVLDCGWQPSHFVTLKRAALLLVKGKAQVVEEDVDGRQLRSACFTQGMPRVIALTNKWHRVIRSKVPLNRHHLWLRDKGTCQYCGKHLRTQEMTIEHVVPRCQGGLTVWTNVVVACQRCNNRKDNKTPEQAGMPLLTKPVEPKPSDPRYMFRTKSTKMRPEWMKWLYAEKASWIYWNVELEK